MDAVFDFVEDKAEGILTGLYIGRGLLSSLCGIFLAVGFAG